MNEGKKGEIQLHTHSRKYLLGHGFLLGEAHSARAVGREWLHDDNAFYEKMMELNLTYSADLVVGDATSIYVDSAAFKEVAEPGIIIVGSNRVAVDSVSVTLMILHGVHGVSDRPVLGHEQFTISKKLGLGYPSLDMIDLGASNLREDKDFDELISGIRMELTD